MHDDAWKEHVDTALTNHDLRLGKIEDQERRTRSRLHNLEGGARALDLAAEAVERLAVTARRGIPELNQIADAAAHRAIQRDRRRRAQNRRGSWLFRATVAGGFGGLGYTLFVIATHLVRLAH